MGPVHVRSVPLLDRIIAYGDHGRCRMREFDPRVVVVSDLPHSDPPVFEAISDVARVVEQILDARFYGTSWRLIEHVPVGMEGALVLVTFGGYDRRTGDLVNPARLPLPAVMEWLRSAIR